MKTALKIGFSITIEHWKSTLLYSRFLIFTFILITLLESFLLYEVSQILGSLSWSYNSISIINVDLLNLSDDVNSLASYLYRLSRNSFHELILLNSFFLGVYYHYTGFPKHGENSSNIDTVLDVPIETNQRPSIGLVVQYVKKENRIYYFKMILLFIVVEIVGEVVGDLLYRILTVVGYAYYWLFRLVPYFLLLLLYLKWLDLPFSTFWKHKEKWLLVIVGGLFVPVLSSYILVLSNSILNIVSYAFLSITEIGNLMHFFARIAYYMLLVPFISIFYSQTLIYFQNEQEA